MFASELCELFRVLERLRIRKRRFYLACPVEGLGESISEAQLSLPLSLPYFWRKRSTRPAVSISFCLPVKNG